jgi:NAD(P)-dependent dehydrogenase (short-subunit alcohol dehydrogenase family)
MADGKRTAIVTGAASGLGQAMALGLCRAGFDVVAVDRQEARLAALSADGPGTLLPYATDLGQPASFERIVSTALERFGRIDVLVNNAGIGQASVRADQRHNPIRFWEVTPEQWGQFVAVNATAPIMLARAVVPHMLKAGRGRIVTVTTSLGTMVREGYLLYGASKAAAEAAMAVLAADLKGTGVTANVLVPGGVTNTPLVGEDAGDRARMLQPEIMVKPLLWLVSDAASDVSARRFIAADWDVALPDELAAEKAGAPIAWLGIARMPIEPQ